MYDQERRGQEEREIESYLWLDKDSHEIGPMHQTEWFPCFSFFERKKTEEWVHCHLGILDPSFYGQVGGYSFPIIERDIPLFCFCCIVNWWFARLNSLCSDVVTCQRLWNKVALEFLDPKTRRWFLFTCIMCIIRSHPMTNAKWCVSFIRLSPPPVLSAYLSKSIPLSLRRQHRGLLRRGKS